MKELNAKIRKYKIGRISILRPPENLHLAQQANPLLSKKSSSGSQTLRAELIKVQKEQQEVANMTIPLMKETIQGKTVGGWA